MASERPRKVSFPDSAADPRYSTMPPTRSSRTCIRSIKGLADRVTVAGLLRPLPTGGSGTPESGGYISTCG